MKRRVQSFGLASVLLLGVLTLAGCPDDGAIDGSVIGHKTTSKGVTGSLASPSPTPTASASAGTSNTSITSGIDASAPPANLATLPPTPPSPAPTPIGTVGQPISVPNSPAALAFLTNTISPLIVRSGDVVQLDSNQQPGTPYTTGLSQPTLIAVDGTSPYTDFWVVSAGSDRIDHLTRDPMSGIGPVSHYAIAANPDGLAVDSTEAWITHSGGTVTRLNTSSGAISTFSLASPTAVALQPGNAWVTASPNLLYKISRSGSASSSITVGSGPVAVAVDRLGDVWTANGTAKTVSYVAAGASTATSLPVAGTPTAVAVDTDRVWVGMSSPSQVAYYGLNGTLQGTASVPIAPSALAVDAEGNVWAANPGSTMVITIQGR